MQKYLTRKEINPKVPKMKTDESANSVDPDEVAHLVFAHLLIGMTFSYLPEFISAQLIREINVSI